MLINSEELKAKLNYGRARVIETCSLYTHAQCLASPAASECINTIDTVLELIVELEQKHEQEHLKYCNSCAQNGEDK